MNISLKTDSNGLMNLSSAEGFTIIELLIATTVFSMILLVISIAMIQIGKTYSKGITEAHTQEIARSALDEISQSIQFSGAHVRQFANYNSHNYGFCIDNKRYSYVIGKELETNPATVGPLAGTQSQHVLVVDNVANCASIAYPQEVDNPSAYPLAGRELLGEHMRLGAFILQGPPVKPNTTIYNLTLFVIYGDNDVLDITWTGTTCKSGSIGGQFCAISILNTTVEKRVQ